MTEKKEGASPRLSRPRVRGPRDRSQRAGSSGWEEGPYVCDSPAQKPVPQPVECSGTKPEPAGARQPGAGRHLDGGGAALLVLALAQQAVGLHVTAGHRHGLHHVQAGAARGAEGGGGAGPRAGPWAGRARTQSRGRGRGRGRRRARKDRAVTVPWKAWFLQAEAWAACVGGQGPSARSPALSGL